MQIERDVCQWKPTGFGGFSLADVPLDLHHQSISTSFIVCHDRQGPPSLSLPVSTE